MALIKCSECGKEISDQSTSCIHCGCPINKQKTNRNKIIVLLIIVILFAVLCVLGFILVQHFSNKNVSEQSTNEYKNDIQLTNNSDIDIIETTTESKSYNLETNIEYSNIHTKTYTTIHTHTFSDATCSTSKRCSVCGTTIGSVLGHEDDGTGYCINCSTQLYVIEEREEIVVSSTSLTIQEPATLTINVCYQDSKYPDGISLNANYDSSIVETEWGEWEGLYTTSLKIIPIKNGTVTMRISFVENPNVYCDVKITVNNNSTGDSYVSYGEDEYYQLARDAYEHIQKELPYPHSLDLVSAEAGTVDGKKAVYFSYTTLDVYGDKDWYFRYCTYTPNGKRISAFHITSVDFIYVMDLDVDKIILQ